jgi:hypothetical protein
MFGDKPYQIRAGIVLPILVRQAEAAEPIYYSDLAKEVGMPNARNLNYVLGSIGKTLNKLSEIWKKSIPPIQCLVVNKNTKLPGEGIGWFFDEIDKKAFASRDKKQQRLIVNAKLQDIYSFGEWREVLSDLSLQPQEINYSEEINKASSFHGGGESEDHKRLKIYISKNPTSVGLPGNTSEGETEFRLSSGDLVDIHFKIKLDWVAVEAKSKVSEELDIIRGLFQCVKYKAVFEAMQRASNLPQNARAILALEGKFPPNLISLKNILGVEVIDYVYQKEK